MSLASADKGKPAAYGLGGFVLFAALATILAALAFEHIGGYLPCPLCLQQRWAYYAGVPLSFLGLVLLSAQSYRWAAFVFLFVSLSFLANSGLGVYQSGAEWGFWPGPESCGAAQPIATSAGDLLGQLSQTRVVSCAEPNWRLFGLSFAGWNAVVSFVLFITALKAAFASVEGER